MIVFALLLLLWLIARAPFVRRLFSLHARFDAWAWALGGMFLLAGMLHFLRPEPFITIVPPGFPSPAVLVALSGLAEIVIGLLLWVPNTRHYGGFGAMLLLLAVYPANIYAAMSEVEVSGYSSAAWFRWLRVALQLPLIALAVRIWRR